MTYMDELEKLKADLALAGWEIGRNNLDDIVGWYAWLPKRPDDWPDCEYNNKPPALCIMPYACHYLKHSKVEVEVSGELAGRWYKLRSYGIPASEAMDALPKVIESLGAAWKAIAALDTQ